ncbi:MAG: type II toxin-antitoxin system RelB/DinJ family antitoxin [Angelakisella sp.]|jgi:DNA-damage-inducible protein J|nr:type II toxin-antitoxin system RelB/DinJ family antitoxin [Angelakisella sp.]
MTTIQIRVDDTLKKEADALFASLGLDTTTAVRIFLNAAVENAGIPFSVQHREIPEHLQEAIYDSRYRRNLIGPFATAEEAVAAMLED